MTRVEHPTRRGARRAEASPTRRRLGRRVNRLSLARGLFLVPALAYVCFTFLLPAAYNVILSFEKTSPATIANLISPWAGLANYRAVLLDPTTQSALVHTSVFTVGSLLFQFVIGFAMALLFNLQFPLRRFSRSLIIVPWLLPLLVTGVMFRFLFRLEGGAVNQALLDLHIVHQPVDFLLSPKWAFVTLLVTNIWIGIPFFTLLLFSALQDVPKDLMEAAVLDGTSAWQRLVHVTVPIIRPVVEVTFMLGFVFTVKVFDIVIGVTSGGPANSTQLISTWAYNLSFQNFEYGQGAALNTVLFVIAMLAAPLYLWQNRQNLRAG